MAVRTRSRERASGAAERKKARAGDQLPRVEVADRSELRGWLQRSHASASGVWIVTRKKRAGGLVAWSDVVEEALCFGWVDSLPRKLDAEHSMLLLTPRKASSRWSAKNKAHVADLERRGAMQPAGRAAVERAKRNGTWTALDGVEALEVPSDLATALAAQRGARAYWDAFPPSIRRGILEWILSAKREATRRARIDETATLAAKNVRANQWSRS